MYDVHDDIIERTWRCCCGGEHFLTLSRLAFGDDEDWAGLIIQDIYDGLGWRERLRRAWRMLRHGGDHGWIEMELSHKATREIHQELTDILAWWEQRRQKAKPSTP